MGEGEPICDSGHLLHTPEAHRTGGKGGRVGKKGLGAAKAWGMGRIGESACALGNGECARCWETEKAREAERNGDRWETVAICDIIYLVRKIRGII